MATCLDCGHTVGPFNLTIDFVQGRCRSCHNAYVARLNELEAERCAVEKLRSEIRELAEEKMILTTESAHNLPVSERLGIVTAECVIGMHLLKDAMTALRDVFGGRSATMQNGLREARELALTDLRAEAAELGADAVVAVDLDYSEISGAGRSMLFLVASGTAVKLDR